MRDRTDGNRTAISPQFVPGWDMTIVFWGTYDTGKPRVRILLDGVKSTGNEVIECHTTVWSDVVDKSQVSKTGARLRLLAKWLLSYPSLIWRYLGLPRHDVVVVGYLGHLDVLVLFALAKFRGVPVVWDVFLSLYSTIVEDRKLVGRRHPLAYFLHFWEWAACRAADLIILDTRAHAEYFVNRYKVSREKTGSVFIGVDPRNFPESLPNTSTGVKEKSVVLFFGQFIPLHGLETICRAANLARQLPIQWVLIGQGQEEAQVARWIADAPNVTHLPLLPYDELLKRVEESDICLGIFGRTDKAARVIPNKVFEILRVGKPLITRDSPAIRELLSPEMPGVRLVPPADPESLFRAVTAMIEEMRSQEWINLHSEVSKRILPRALGAHLIEQVEHMRAAGNFSPGPSTSADRRPKV